MFCVGILLSEYFVDSFTHYNGLSMSIIQVFTSILLLSDSVWYTSKISAIYTTTKVVMIMIMTKKNNDDAGASYTHKPKYQMPAVVAAMLLLSQFPLFVSNNVVIN